MQFCSGRRVVLAAFSFLAVGAVLCAAEPPVKGDKTLLDEARRRDEVAQQKAEADFRSALLEMNKLENANPARAVERLKKMLAVLDEDTVLSPSKRAAWQRVLKDRIRVTEAEADRAAKGVPDEAVRVAKKDDRRSKDEEKEREDAQIKRDLNDIRRAQVAGRTEEAQRMADDLARRNPNSPAATASKYITGVGGALRANRELKDERDRRFVGAMLEIERSAMPMIGEIEFPSPAKWREITKARTKSVATEREKAILKALDTPVSAKFEGSTLESVIDYLQTLTGVTIILDKNTLDAVGASYDTPVNVKVRNVSFRTLLRKVLGEVPGGLTYIVEKETIHAMTTEQAKKTLTVRTYFLGDLAGAADMTLGPIGSKIAMLQNVAMLIQTITGTIEPDSWKVNNADALGTIYFDPVSLNLIVKQSAEIHYMLGGIGR
jgi:hypothetical protein